MPSPSSMLSTSSLHRAASYTPSDGPNKANTNHPVNGKPHASLSSHPGNPPLPPLPSSPSAKPTAAAAANGALLVVSPQSSSERENALDHTTTSSNLPALEREGKSNGNGAGARSYSPFSFSLYSTVNSEGNKALNRTGKDAAAAAAQQPPITRGGSTIHGNTALPRASSLTQWSFAKAETNAVANALPNGERQLAAAAATAAMTTLNERKVPSSVPAPQALSGRSGTQDISESSHHGTNSDDTSSFMTTFASFNARSAAFQENLSTTTGPESWGDFYGYNYTPSLAVAPSQLPFPPPPTTTATAARPPKAAVRVQQIRPLSRVPDVLQAHLSATAATTTATPASGSGGNNNNSSSSHSTNVQRLTSPRKIARPSSRLPGSHKRRPASRAEYFAETVGDNASQDATQLFMTYIETGKDPLLSKEEIEEALKQRDASSIPTDMLDSRSRHSTNPSQSTATSVDYDREEEELFGPTSKLNDPFDTRSLFSETYFSSASESSAAKRPAAHVAPEAATTVPRKPNIPPNPPSSVITTKDAPPSGPRPQTHEGSPSMMSITEMTSLEFATLWSMDSFIDLPQSLTNEAPSTRGKKTEKGQKPSEEVPRGGQPQPAHTSTPKPTTTAAAARSPTSVEKLGQWGNVLPQHDLTATVSSATAGDTSLATQHSSVSSKSFKSPKSSKGTDFFNFLKGPQQRASSKTSTSSTTPKTTATAAGGRAQQPRQQQLLESKTSGPTDNSNTNSTPGSNRSGEKTSSHRAGLRPTDVVVLSSSPSLAKPASLQSIRSQRSDDATTTSTVTISRPPSLRRRKHKKKKASRRRTGHTSADTSDCGSSSANSSRQSTPRSTGSKRSGRGFNLAKVPADGKGGPQPHATPLPPEHMRTPRTHRRKVRDSPGTSSADLADMNLIDFGKVKDPPVSQVKPPERMLREMGANKKGQPPQSITAHIGKSSGYASRSVSDLTGDNLHTLAANLQRRGVGMGDSTTTAHTSLSDTGDFMRMAPFLHTVQTAVKASGEGGRVETKSDMLQKVRALAKDPQNSAPPRTAPGAAAAAVGDSRHPTAHQQSILQLATATPNYVNGHEEVKESRHEFTSVCAMTSDVSAGSSLSCTGGAYSVDSRGVPRKRRERVVSFAADTLDDNDDDSSVDVP